MDPGTHCSRILAGASLSQRDLRAFLAIKVRDEVSLRLPAEEGRVDRAAVDFAARLFPLALPARATATEAFAFGIVRVCLRRTFWSVRDPLFPLLLKLAIS